MSPIAPRLEHCSISRYLYFNLLSLTLSPGLVTIPASRTRKRSSSTLKCARTKIVMPLTVLSNHDVRSLLLSLTGDEIRKLQANLAEALRTYSTGNQDPGLLLRESATSGGLSPRQLVEIEKLLMVKGATEKTGDPPDKGLVEWLQKGNVIYKCVGLILMDLVVGVDILYLARERNI
ncbi:predicted protein [Coccidioides posadasii str. Silveira]|uniref:Predicted protein n=1 Tax=Coccidioides posadasii (strain RMSCC 757 / Silveira) TaxID=443226 RepID=E9DFF9_COCPS|nr:predicted protein [Coccidioides posadasii str. Silveira]